MIRRKMGGKITGKEKTVPEKGSVGVKEHILIRVNKR